MSQFHLDRASWFKWYWRRPGQLPFQYGPYKFRFTARRAARRATR